MHLRRTPTTAYHLRCRMCRMLPFIGFRSLLLAESSLMHGSAAGLGWTVSQWWGGNVNAFHATIDFLVCECGAHASDRRSILARARHMSLSLSR